jgi:signal transduction histidine kinase
MSFKWMQSYAGPPQGYFSLFGGRQGLVIYAIQALVLSAGVLGYDVRFAVCLLLFPFVLGLAVLAGLLYRMAGALASVLISFSISSLGYILHHGVFEALSGPQSLLFLFGWCTLVAFFSLAGAISIGYSLRTAEVAVNRQNLLYKVFDALPIGIWVRARDGRSLFVNDRWASFSAMSSDEILTSDSGNAPVDLGDEWRDSVAEVLDSDHSAVRYQSIELTDHSGQRSSMTLLTLRMMIDQENDFGTLSLLIDETAVRLYEAKVRQSEQNLHLALNNARMGFWDENVSTKVAQCDDNWYRLIDAKRDPKQSPLSVWKARIHPDDRTRVIERYREYYKNGKGSFRVDYRIRKGDQDYIWVQDSTRVIEYDAQGHPLRVMGTMQDISDQKQAELELQLAKERAETGNRAKSQFIATISHEIRTPLNAIIGLSSFLSEGELEGEALDLAQTINSSGKGLLLLVNDILDFSKIESGRMELETQEFPLRLCFEECVKLFKVRAAEKSVAITLDLSDQLTEFAVGDMGRLRQIVQNLLANALKFTEVGKVRLSVQAIQLSQVDEAHRPDPLDSIGYLDEPDHTYLKVSVKDTGIGIPVDQQHLLFEAFSQVDSSMTRQYGGTGLGLVICKRLVAAMGGCIWLESEAGQGATFSFVVRTKLIRNNPQPVDLSSEPVSPVERIAAAHPCDILLVGPEDAMRELMQSCRQLGYAPHSMHDYDLAGSAYRRRHYNIMFIWMADERRAFELARGISTGNQMLKPDALIACPSTQQQLSKDRCRLNGMHDVMSGVNGAPGAMSPQAVREIIFRVLDVRD